MSKNVAVFVDVANIFYAAKAAGVDIDYVTLLKSASAGRDLVRAYAYTGLDPDNENQRNFHSFLARNNYRVVSKDIRKYGDGKVKANLDIELVVDMMKTARNLDIAIVVSGDGDFAPAIRAVQEQGVRVEVISFRGNTSSDLIEVADQFTDITALAKVEKGSSRSGRRVALDDEDLSMTEVPDKQTEGTGAGRSRGRGGRGGRSRFDEPAARIERREAVAVTSGGTTLVVLPGEKLSRVAPETTPDRDAAALETDGDSALEGAAAAFGRPAPVSGQAPGAPDVDRGEDGELDADGRRRRRRRGGRGRGRGRGRGEGVDAPAILDPVGAEPVGLSEAPEEAPVFEAPRGPRPTPFGSVWDSQLGTSTPAPTPSRLEPLGDDEDFEEPEIPEYLLAERNQRGRGPGGPAGRGQAGRAGGGRGGNRSAYAAAMDRERYGRGGGGGGINRYPDVSARERPPQRDRDERFARPAPGGGGPNRSGGDEPWSEVPPELEAMLRAQQGTRGAPRPTGGRPTGERPSGIVEASAAEMPSAEAPTVASPQPDTETKAPAPRPTRRGRRTAAEVGLELAAEATMTAPVPHPADAGPVTPPARRRRSTPTAADGAVAASGDAPVAGDAEAPPKRRTTRRRAEPTDGAAPEAATGTTGIEPGAPPKRRVTRRKAADVAAAETSGDEIPGDPESSPSPKRRTTRRKPAEDAPGA